MKTKSFFLSFATSLLLLNLVFMANAVQPAIEYQPQNQSLILYQQAAFGVIASGTSPLAYQWLKNGAPVLGATNDQLVIPQTQFSDEGLYSIVVSNIDGSVTSTNAELRVKLPRTGDVDFSFVRPGRVGLDVRATAIQGDGKILLAGHFAGTGAILRLHADGTQDYTFLNEAIVVNGTIVSVAVQSDGKILIGGGFTQLNGQTYNRLARLNANGSIDDSFMEDLSGVTYNGYNLIGAVNSLAIQSDGKILIGGDFNRVNGISRTNIARLNEDGTLDDSFQCAVSGKVHSLALLDGGGVLVGGALRNVNGTSLLNIARLNIDGSLDTGFENPAFGQQGFYNGVYSIALQKDGKIIIGGNFGSIAGESHHNLARLDANGSLDGSFQASVMGSTVPPPVSTISVRANGGVIIGGSFPLANGENKTNIARLNGDGSLDRGFQASAGSSPYLETVSSIVENNGRLIVGGSILTVNGEVRHGVARLNNDGSLDNSFPEPPLPMVDGSVVSFALQPDGRMLIGGDFRSVNSVPNKYLARLNIDGSLDTTFLTDLDAPVNLITLQEDGNVLLAGAFSRINGLSRNRIARLNPDGTLDEGFQNQMSGVNGGPIEAVAVQSDGKVLIAGRFKTVNDISRTNIARLNSDGSLDTTFQGSFGSPVGSDTLYSIVVQADGKVLVSGYSGIARFEIDGSRDTNFHGVQVSRETTFNDSPFWTSATVSSMVPTPDNKLLVCGDFDTIDGIERHGVARLNMDGTLDNAYVTDVSHLFISHPLISSMRLESDGKLLIAGYFYVTNYVNPIKLALLNSDGALNRVLLESISPPGDSIDQMALQSDGRMIISGNFSMLNGVAAPYLARLWVADFPPVLKNPYRTGNNVNLNWRAISNRTYRVQFSDDLSGNIWAELPGDVSATGDTATKTDAISNGQTQRFYRVLQVP